MMQMSATLVSDKLLPETIGLLQEAFGAIVLQDTPLARYTAARIGGPAEVLLEIESADLLEKVVTHLWDRELPFHVLGGGSNVLVSDAGVKGIVLVNRSRPAGKIHFESHFEQPSVMAEAGVNLGVIARQAAQYGLAGLEWAAGIPGTLGGAVVGNAGAHGSDIASQLLMVEILQRERQPGYDAYQRIWLTPDRLGFHYRSSVLKERPGDAVVIKARLGLKQSESIAVQAKMDEFTEYRRRTQPPGASMGSMFKNPTNDYAGRLIEAAGLKSFRVGDVMISPLHANFFVNLGGATAGHVYSLILMAQQRVFEKFGVELELEIELIGEFDSGDEQ